MKRSTFSVAALGTLLTLLWAIPALALDHIQEVDSVDCFPGGCEIR